MCIVVLSTTASGLLVVYCVLAAVRPDAIYSEGHRMLVAQQRTRHKGQQHHVESHRENDDLCYESDTFAEALASPALPDPGALRHPQFCLHARCARRDAAPE